MWPPQIIRLMSTHRRPSITEWELWSLASLPHPHLKATHGAGPALCPGLTPAPLFILGQGWHFCVPLASCPAASGAWLCLAVDLHHHHHHHPVPTGNRGCCRKQKLCVRMNTGVKQRWETNWLHETKQIYISKTTWWWCWREFSQTSSGIHLKNRW